MRQLWKIAVPVTLVVLIGGAIAFLLVHRHQIEEQKLVQEAQAYRVRAEHGEAEAEYRLARMYLNGQGVPQSYADALRWYRKAAEQNFAKAQYAFGYSYYHGYGTDGDFTEALRWFHLAADQQLPGAENHIGIAYEVGNGVTADYREAVRWYQLAADQGYAAAQYNLGWLYANGEGVTKDRVKARLWVTKAADQGYRPAKQMLGRSWPALSRSESIRLIIGLTGGFVILLGARILKLDPKSQMRGLGSATGLVILLSVVLDLLGFAYAGILAPPSVVAAFGFARGFAQGVLLSLFLRMVWRNSPKWGLWASGLLFVAFDALVLARFNRLQIETSVRFLLFENGMSLGLGITSAVLLLRKRQRGETGGRFGPDEIAETKDGEHTHS